MTDEEAKEFLLLGMTVVASTLAGAVIAASAGLLSDNNAAIISGSLLGFAFVFASLSFAIYKTDGVNEVAENGGESA